MTRQTGMVGLMVYKMAIDGSREGLAGAVRMLSSTESIRAAAVAAKKWCADAVAAVRGAGDPNPWRNASDDEIADEILRQLEAKAKCMRRRGVATSKRAR